MPKKVVVAMSGGVDSSVTAALLKERGYEVIGITMRLSDWEETEGRQFGGCCGSKDFYDARGVAQTLGIPHYALDYVEAFRQDVIGYYKESYLRAETPNPCIACNAYIKFDRLLRQAQAFGADFLATGHYARIEKIAVIASEAKQSTAVNDRDCFVPRLRKCVGRAFSIKNKVGPVATAPRNDIYSLRRARDVSKDQSYVLYHLGQAELARLMFPLGDYTKTEVRDIARRHGLKTAEKPDSQEACFVPNADYRAYLKEEFEKDKKKLSSPLMGAGPPPPADAGRSRYGWRRPGGRGIRAGDIRDLQGNLVGRHQGLPFYTVGQRKGLGGTAGKPLYVVALDRETNTVVVGDKQDVLFSGGAVREVRWVGDMPPDFPVRAMVQIRAHHEPAAAVIARSVATGPTLFFIEKARPTHLRRRGTKQSPGRSLRSPKKRGGPRDDGRSVACNDDHVVVHFDTPQPAVTPGQAAVFYDGDIVLGGGVIDRGIR